MPCMHVLIYDLTKSILDNNNYAVRETLCTSSATSLRILMARRPPARPHIQASYIYIVDLVQPKQCLRMHVQLCKAWPTLRRH
eukprot:scaffold376799_cov26-Prasinocladus_malaysianus.AAC.1